MPTWQEAAQGARAPQLLKASEQFDLQRAQPGDEKHVSSTDDKEPLRADLRREALMRRLLDSLTVLLGYADGPVVGSADLCEQVRSLCATTRVRFFQWCSSGRVQRGQIASIPDCGEDAREPEGSWSANPYLTIP